MEDENLPALGSYGSNCRIKQQQSTFSKMSRWLGLYRKSAVNRSFKNNFLRLWDVNEKK